MNSKSKFLGILLCWAAMGHSQTPASVHHDTVEVNTLLQLFRETIGTSREKAISYATAAKNLSEKAKYPKGLATALKSLGIAEYYGGTHVKALAYWQESLKVFESIGDDVGVANILSNIGALYFNQAENEKALEYYLRSLKISERLGDKLRIATALNNVGGVFNKKSTYDKALKYFLDALPLAEATGDVEAIRTTATNLGEVYGSLNSDSLALVYFNRAISAGDDSESSPYTFNMFGNLYSKRGSFDRALFYHRKAYQVARNFDGKLDIVQSLLGIGSTHEKKRDFAEASIAYNEAENIAISINANKELEQIYKGMATALANMGDFTTAYGYTTKHALIKDKLYDEARDNKIAFMQYDFDLQKKESQINLLTKENTLREVQLNRQRILRTALVIVLGLILVIAIIIFRNYRAKARINKILDQQKGEIERLLLNILPEPVARELQQKGEATPSNYECVSVLFTDFKGFTSIADHLSPGEIVNELNTFFVAFDNIIDKYGLEKIKTIGDSYMCAGGVPLHDDNHIYKMVKAGMEMQNYMIVFNSERQRMKLPVWDLRIGIHAGPVIAGVVGKKKYAYDIWGSTVNIASRMESNGAPGRVNISNFTYEKIRDRFVCSPRGKIFAKNVGEIDMYFVEHEINPFLDVPVSTSFSENGNREKDDKPLTAALEE